MEKNVVNIHQFTSIEFLTRSVHFYYIIYFIYTTKKLEY